MKEVKRTKIKILLIIIILMICYIFIERILKSNTIPKIIQWVILFISFICSMIALLVYIRALKDPFAESSKSLIYAVDFDGTLNLTDESYPSLGRPNKELFYILKELQKRGNKIILWTCRTGAALDAAVYFCEGYGLKFDAVNENLPEVIEEHRSDPRKIGYDVLIDDRVIHPAKFIKKFIFRQ